ncbi:MAG: PAS domain S-box protein, partial [Actinomycetes bacterium]
MDDRADSGGDTTGLRDIDEKVLARHALEASERRYRLLAENATDSVFLVDPSGVLTWVSPATEKVLGYPPQDLLGTRTVDLVHPEDLPEMLARRARAANGETGVPFEVRVRNVSGAFRWMSGSSSNVEDGDGTVIGRISTMRDVHEQVLAREQLNAERARLRATLDSLLDPHVLLEAVRDGSGEIVDFVYTDANPAACTYNGLAYRDLMGARLLELLPGHVASGLLDQYQHVVQTGEPLALNDFVYAQELLGGVQRYYDIRAARVGDGLSYTWRDVTHRHDAVEALAAAEHRFRLLAENASDIVWRLDGDAIISWVSPSVESVLGWTPDQVVGTSPRELTHPDDLDLLLKRWAGTTSDRTPAPFEIRARAADGGYRWMSI